MAMRTVVTKSSAGVQPGARPFCISLSSCCIQWHMGHTAHLPVTLSSVHWLAVLRVHRSSVDTDALCLHECEIIGEGGKFWPSPTFMVTARDREDEPVMAKSCTGCWSQVGGV